MANWPFMESLYSTIAKPRLLPSSSLATITSSSSPNAANIGVSISTVTLGSRFPTKILNIGIRRLLQSVTSRAPLTRVASKTRKGRRHNSLPDNESLQHRGRHVAMRHSNRTKPSNHHTSSGSETNFQRKKRRAPVVSHQGPSSRRSPTFPQSSIIGRKVLTSEFGMGSGISPCVNSPTNPCGSFRPRTGLRHDGCRLNRQGKHRDACASSRCFSMRVGGTSHDSWHHPYFGVMFDGSGPLRWLPRSGDGIRSTWPSDRPFVPLR